MSEEIIVGIDLGTTFSAIAYVNDYGKPEIIPNSEGDRTTPSAIFFEEDGNAIVGKEALNLALVESERVIRFVKREMDNPSYRINIDGEEYTPESLSAIILKKLKTDAEQRLGKPINKAVISVPAYFKDAQREATRQAGEIAGLEVIRILNEPTAAALAYGLDKENNQTLLIYDFGGGTFDVTLMKVNGKEFTVLGTDGDSHLGGSDIDQLLIDFLAKEFQDTYDIDLRENPQTQQDLRDKAEIAKKDLSSRNSTQVILSQGGQTAKIDIDLDDFNDLIEDLVAKTEHCINRVIEDVAMDWSEIDRILLVGGSSRIPAVREMVKQVTGKEPARDINPDECVAIGAAIQAIVTVTEADKATENTDNLSDSVPQLEGDGNVDIRVVDIAAHSLGVRALSSDGSKPINSIIIPRLTQIPCERTKIYATSEDNQKRVEFDVLQGEDENPRSPDVDRIGKAGLKNLPPHKAGELMIEVTLRYNADGIIEVVTKEQQSGQISREVVMQKSGTLSEEIVKEKQRQLNQMSL